MTVPPRTTLEEVKCFAFATGKLVFTGQVAEACGQARSNIGDVGQAL